MKQIDCKAFSGIFELFVRHFLGTWVRRSKLGYSMSAPLVGVVYGSVIGIYFEKNVSLLGIFELWKNMAYIFDTPIRLWKLQKSKKCQKIISLLGIFLMKKILNKFWKISLLGIYIPIRDTIFFSDIPNRDMDQKISLFGTKVAHYGHI